MRVVLIQKIILKPLFRPVKRAIQNEVLNALSKEIIAGKVQADDVILLDAFEGELVFRNVDLPIS